MCIRWNLSHQTAKHRCRLNPSLSLILALGGCSLAAACTANSDDLGSGPSVSKIERESGQECCLLPGQHIPSESEIEVSGAIGSRVRRGSKAFAALVRVGDARIVFKDEEGTSADRHMTRRLRARLRQLAVAVEREWPSVKLRVTEAWDERHEHGRNSLHYEGRAADITTSDVDHAKLGRLARLAVAAGFDWVYFEDGSHVHVSVRP